MYARLWELSSCIFFLSKIQKFMLKTKKNPKIKEKNKNGKQHTTNRPPNKCT